MNEKRHNRKSRKRPPNLPHHKILPKNHVYPSRELLPKHPFSTHIHIVHVYVSDSERDRYCDVDDKESALLDGYAGVGQVFDDYDG